MKKIYILQAFKKKFIFYIFLIILLFITVSIFSFFNFLYNSRNQNLIDSLGSQRYIIQQMSKEVYKIHIELDNLNKNPDNHLYNDDLEASQKKLVDLRNIFSETLTSINKGELTTTKGTLNFKSSLSNISKQLSEVNILWSDIEPEIKIIESSKTLNDSTIKASTRIGGSTDSFINNINSINSLIIADYKRTSYYTLVFIIFLSFIAVTSIVILWINLYRNILNPLNALFTNISNIGIESGDYSTKKSSKSLNPLIQEVNEAFDKLDSLIDLIENINKSSSFNEILEYIYYSFTPFIPFTYIGMALIEDGGKTLKAAYGISDDNINGTSPAKNLLGYTTHIENTSLTKVLKTGIPRIINNLDAYTRGKPIKTYNRILLDAGIKSSITLPIKHNNKAVGIIFFSSKTKNSYTEDHAQFLMTIANSISIAFEKNIFIRDIVLSSIIALAKLAESRDEDTGEHLNRMSTYSETIAELLYKKSKYWNQITPEFIDDIEKFSPLHDIGKVGIADKILLKPSKLTTEEFDEMKKHTIFGGKVLRAADNNIEKEGVSLFDLGREIAENHHEKWDGSGYPRGLKGEEIPLSARIVAVADVFDALTSRRPYKEPFPLDMALNIISEESGKHFDPEIVKVFLENKAVIIELYNKFPRE